MDKHCDRLHEALFRNGYYAQDVTDAGWAIFDREEGPLGDEWMQVRSGVWQHRKDPAQKGEGRVLASGIGWRSLEAYLVKICQPLTKELALILIKQLRDRINNASDSHMTGVGDDPPWINAVVDHLDAAGDVIEFPKK